MSEKKYVTLLVVPDDNSEPRRLHMQRWMFHTLLVVIALFIITPFVYVGFHFRVLAQAARADRLAEENEALKKYQYKVQILEQSLLESRQVVAQIAEMAGLDQGFLSQLYGDSSALPVDSPRPIRPGALSRTLPPSSPIPDGLPATGWISRGFSDATGSGHTGVDLAIAEGSPVYATAFGEVTRASWDDIYGYMVVIRNSDSIDTVFGHNSKLLVNPGDTVFAGQEIALSGNTGKSSAPHLHYEIRVHGKPINPIKYFVYEDDRKN